VKKKERSRSPSSSEVSDSSEAPAAAKSQASDVSIPSAAEEEDEETAVAAKRHPGLLGCGPVDQARLVYNMPCSNYKQMDVKGVDQTVQVVSNKVNAFMQCFEDGAALIDLKSGKEILKDVSAITNRYRTVFRESGPTLNQTLRKRITFRPKNRPGAKPVFVIDFESHAHIVSPVGVLLDGSTGLSAARDQDLIVLYLTLVNKVERAWVAPDKAGLGKESGCDLEKLKQNNEVKMMFGKVEEAFGSIDDLLVEACEMRLCSAGGHSIRGRRPTQEDHMQLCRWHHDGLIDTASPPTLSQHSFIGVYDGHGGDQAALFTSENLHKKLIEHLDDGVPVKTALEKAYTETSDEFMASTDDQSGTCGIVVLVCPGLDGAGAMMHVAHAGDCRAVLGSGAQGNATRLTEDHKPDREDEKARIEAAGGSVQYYKCWRVSAPQHGMMLATSRSLGDSQFKILTDKTPHHIVSAEPEVASREVVADDRFVILACDGVWDVLSDQQACDVVNEHIQNNATHTPQTAANALVSAAFDAGSPDNITAAVGIFHYYGTSMATVFST